MPPSGAGLLLGRDKAAAEMRHVPPTTHAGRGRRSQTALTNPAGTACLPPADTRARGTAESLPRGKSRAWPQTPGSAHTSSGPCPGEPAARPGLAARCSPLLPRHRAAQPRRQPPPKPTAAGTCSCARGRRRYNSSLLQSGILLNPLTNTQGCRLPSGTPIPLPC